MLQSVEGGASCSISRSVGDTSTFGHDHCGITVKRSDRGIAGTISAGVGSKPHLPAITVANPWEPLAAIRI